MDNYNLEEEILEKDKLHWAVQQADVDSIKQFLEDGNSVNTFDEMGNTPLHYATEQEDVALIKLLLEAGADVNAQDEETAGSTPLTDVAGYCSYKVAKLLIEAGADPTIKGWAQLTALDKVRRRKKADGLKVKELLEKAAKSSVRARKT